LSLNGPFAWEAMVSLEGQEIIGMPYLSFYRPSPDRIYFRAGKTGEYGYDLLVPRDRASALRERLSELGKGFDLAELGLAELEQGMLEAFSFNIRREGRAGATPLELQLQWRISYRKESIAAAALKERRARGAQERLTFVGSPERFAIGDAVTFEGRPIGKVVNAGWSEVLGTWLGTALLEVAYAHPKVDRYRVRAAAGSEHPLRTLTPPAILNRSLLVNVQVHSYRTRAENDFPPLVAGR
ncbi:MAG TPA: hypothetical protein VFB81_12775, partial [Myxococcales bacterium]|nr:hypothetical protein [Myxococcales bacterium]